MQRILDELLPENYLTLPEKSLQIGERDDDDEISTRRRMRPDVGVYQERRGPERTAEATASTPTTVAPLGQTIVDYDNPPAAVKIYEIIEGKTPGKLVTQIEILSRSNKLDTQYRIKRQDVIFSGVNLIELDYLHQTRPILPMVSSYPDRDPNAKPYYALVSVPQPSIEEGEVVLYAVGVVEPLPRIVVPLAPGDTIVLDLQETYTRTIQSVRAFRVLADYTQPPVNFEAYTAEDQEHIRAVMAKIAGSD